jgi:hypothetical protein
MSCHEKLESPPWAARFGSLGIFRFQFRHNEISLSQPKTPEFDRKIDNPIQFFNQKRYVRAILRPKIILRLKFMRFLQMADLSRNPARASNEPEPTPDSATPTTASNPAPPLTADTDNPVVTISPPQPRTEVSKMFQHPVTAEFLTEEETTALIAWALQKGKTMAAGDTDELGNLTDYVYAGALAFQHTVQMKNLLEMRMVRGLQIRRAITVNRQQNAQACIAYMCGTINLKRCGPCSRGSGPFQECVTVEGGLLGACASCHYGGEGNRCTFHVSSKSYLSYLTCYDQYLAANIGKESQKEKQAIAVEDSDDARQSAGSRKRKLQFRYPK